MNPLIGSNYLINIFAELEEAKVQVSIWTESSKNPLLNPSEKEKILRGLQRFEALSSLWTTIFQYLIAALLIYLCLYIFIEKEKETTKKKQKKSKKISQKFEIELGNSARMMQDANLIDLEGRLLEDSANSALYREDSFEERNAKVIDASRVALYLFT